MNANVPATRPHPKAQLVAGAPVAALVPQTLEEAFRLAGALAASGMAPRGIDKPEQIMVAIMAGAELGLAPFQSLQSFAVVNGRPTLWGDGLMAVVRARGVKVKETLEGEGEELTARCLVTRADTGEEIERTFAVGVARKANLWNKQGPWQTNPKRMLQMRARAFALRDGCADMLRGIQVREEVEDFQPVRTGETPAGLRERLAGPGGGEGFTAARAADAPVEFAEQAEAIADAEFSDPNVDPPSPEEPVARVDDPEPDPEADAGPPNPYDVRAWADDLERDLPSFKDVDLLRTTWEGRKAELHEADRDRFRDLNNKIARRAAEIAGAV